jgi:hypothetical protein
MERTSLHNQRRNDGELGLIGRTWLVSLVGAGAITFAVAVGSGVQGVIAAKSRVTERPAVARVKTVDSYELILDALLAPALANASVPLRWVDPRVALRCGRHTSVRVNNRALIAGQLVPDGQFEVEWYSDGCHPPGAPDARIDGRVKLVVFREDWGFSAMIEPEGLRIARDDYDYPVVKRGAGSLSRCGESPERLVQTAFEDGAPVPC